VLLAAVVARLVPVPDLSRVHPAPTIRQPPTEVDDVLDPDGGPVLVTVDYVVRADATDVFVDAMTAVGRVDRPRPARLAGGLRRRAHHRPAVRRRTGARRWALYRDPTQPHRFLETFTVATWREHRRQHLGRITVLDRELIEQAHSHLARPLVGSHLVVADAPIRFRPDPTETASGAAHGSDDAADGRGIGGGS